MRICSLLIALPHVTICLVHLPQQFFSGDCALLHDLGVFLYSFVLFRGQICVFPYAAYHSSSDRREGRLIHRYGNQSCELTVVLLRCCDCASLHSDAWITYAGCHLDYFWYA